MAILPIQSNNQISNIRKTMNNDQQIRRQAEETILNQIGINPGAYKLTPMDYEEAIKCMISFHKEQYEKEIDVILSEIKERLHLSWTFDESQRHTHTWHDKQDVLKDLELYFNSLKE